MQAGICPSTVGDFQGLFLALKRDHRQRQKA